MDTYEDESDSLLYKFSYAENVKPAIVKSRRKYYHNPSDSSKPWMLDDLSKDIGGPQELGNEPLKFAKHEEAVERFDRFLREGNIHPTWTLAMLKVGDTVERTDFDGGDVTTHPGVSGTVTRIMDDGVWAVFSLGNRTYERRVKIENLVIIARRKEN